MIEVKIARNLTRDGVEGLRWVLLDPPEATAAVATSGPLATGAAVADGRPGVAALNPPAAPVRSWRDVEQQLPQRTAPRQTLMLGGLKTLVVLLALGAAVATAWRVIGPPHWPGARAMPAALPASQARPAASAPTLTAGMQARSTHRGSGELPQ